MLHFITLSLAQNFHDLLPFTNLGHVLLHSYCPYPPGGSPGPLCGSPCLNFMKPINSSKSPKGDVTGVEVTIKHRQLQGGGDPPQRPNKKRKNDHFALSTKNFPRGMPPNPPNSLIFCSALLALGAAGPLQYELLEPPMPEMTKERCKTTVIKTDQRGVQI